MQLDNEILNIADIAPNRTVLEGRKTKMSEIVNMSLVFTGWTFTESKFQNKRKHEDFYPDEHVEVIEEKSKTKDEASVSGDEQNKDKAKKTKEKRECLTLQFTLDGDLRIVFTSSAVLIQQLRDFLKVKPDATSFRATIKHIDNRFYKFST